MRNHIIVLGWIALFVGICSIFGPSVQSYQADKPLVLMVIPNMDAHSENLKLFENYFGQRGFRFEGVEARTFDSSPEKLKTYLKVRYAQHGLQHLILPPNAFRKPMKVKYRDTEVLIVSDKFYTNLNDDAPMIDEISLGRCSVADLARIARRKLSDTLSIDVAFPILNYSRRGCGGVPIPPTRDASHFGHQLKNLANATRHTLNTYFEQEGSYTSARKADYPLKRELLQQSKANVKFYMSTFEELGYSGGSFTYQCHQAFYQAIFQDQDQDQFVDQGEVSIKPFFSFDEKQAEVHQIGIFPLFDNAQLNLNAFSAIVGFEFPRDIYFHVGDQSGTTGSYFAVLHLVFENLLAGKTIGESIDVYNHYLQRFTNDIYQQEVVALTLFVRGDPTLRLRDLVAAPQAVLHPSEELHISPFQSWSSFEIHNAGNRDLNWKITQSPEWIQVIPNSGTLRPGYHERLLLQVKTKFFYRKAQGTLHIQCNDPQQQEMTLRLIKQGWKK